MVEDPETVKDSILDKQSVSYEGGALKITSALDDYPFPYYIVLRHDLLSLPETLGDALRQWLEMLAAK